MISKVRRLELMAADNEMDTHADTCVLGRNFTPLHYTGRVCNVQPYSDDYSPVTDIAIITGATAYDCTSTFQTYILVFNEGLDFIDRLQHSLINPNQMRYAGINVQDNPFASDGLYIRAKDGITDLSIPMSTQGTIIKFPSRTPSSEELATCSNDNGE
jgi:hypothetical protein